MKKVLATILALVMVLGVTTISWATEGGTESGAVAEMGGTNYDDLHTALEAAKNGGTVIYALSDFLIMILSWLVKRSLRAFLFQEVQP